MGPAWWVGICSILTASIYYEFQGGLFASLFSIALLFIYVFLAPDRAQSLPVTEAGILLSLGLLFGLLVHQLILRLRVARQDWLDAEKNIASYRSPAPFMNRPLLWLLSNGA
jgi:hypothetical protein